MPTEPPPPAPQLVAASTARPTPASARAAATYLLFGLVVGGLVEAFLDVFGLHGGGPSWPDYLKVAGYVGFSAAATYYFIRREERASARSAELLLALADGTPDAVFVKDRQGRYLLINEAGARLVGKSVGEIIGRDDTALFTPEGAAHLLATHRRIMEAGVQAVTEETLTTTARVTRAYSTTRAPYRDETGAVVGTLGIARDVTERRRDEERVRLFRALLDQANDTIEVLDPETGAYLDVNEAASLAHGYTREEYLALKVTDIDPNVKAVGWPPPAEQCPAAGKPVFESLHRRRDGSTFPVEVTLSAITIERRYVVAVVRDITERKRADRALRESEARFAGFMRHMPGLAWIKHADGRYAYANDAALAAFGRTADTLVGRTDADLFPAAVAGEFLANDRLAWESGNALETVERLTHPDGTRHVSFVSKFLIAGGEHGPALLGGVAVDITARVEAEERLRASEERFRTFVDHATDALFLHDGDDGTVRDANRRACECLGYSRDELIGMPVAALDADFSPAKEADLKARMRRGETVTFETRHRRKDGTTVPVEVRIRPFEQGGRRMGIALCRDITARLAADAARRETEERFRAFMDHTPALAWINDETGANVLVNAAFKRAYRTSAEATQGRPLCDFMPGLPVEAFLESDRRVVESGSPHQTVESGPREDGRPGSYLVSKFPLAPAADGRRLVGGVAIDITDRVAAEEALRQSERRFRELADAIPQIVWIASADGQVVEVNAQTLAYTGLAAGGLQGSRWQNVVHPDDRDGVLRGWAGILGSGEPRPSEFRVRKANGEYRWHINRQVPVRVDGAVVQWFGTCTDIEHHKRLEAALLGHNRVLGRIAVGTPVREVLEDICRAIELEVSGSLCSILLKAPDGVRLTFGAGPSLPPEYNRAVDGVPIGPAAGSCGTAAFRNEAVIVTDVGTDPLWADYRDLALGHGLRACWSVPVRVGGRVAGTFAVYHRTPTAPDAESWAAVERVAQLTAVALEREEAGRALQESEERYRRLVEVLPNAVFINAGGRVVFANPALLRLLGATDPGEVLGRTPFDLFAPEYHDLIRQRIAAMRETGRAAAGVEERFVRPDGREVPVHCVATPITDRGEEAILVALSDLTERERSMGLLRTVLGSVSDAILTIDPRGTIETANPTTQRMFGYTQDELVGRNVQVLMPEPHRSVHDSYVDGYLRTGVAKVIGIGRQLDARRKDGTTFPIELTVTEFSLDGERHFTGVVRDITSRRRLEDQYRQAQKMEAIGQLAGGVAHDFNNLLTVINGYSDMLLSDLPGTDPRAAGLAAIRDAGERAAGLTAQLLAFSRKTIVEPKVLDLNELLDNLGRMLRRLIGEDISYTTALDPALGPVRADPGQIEQVVLNLTVNARDAMPRGGRIHVSTHDRELNRYALPAPDLGAGRYALLSVSDTGSGMTADVVGKIFEPFFTTKEQGKGTGLGLATVYGIVKQAGGHVVVESEVGRGTTFTVYLPVVAVPEALQARAGSPAVAPRGSETVLLVEDEEGVRRISQLVLEAQGYKTLSAPNGAAAVAQAEAFPGEVHILVTDVVMPGLSGREVADAVRRTRPGIRVLFMSGYTDDAVVRHGVEASTDAFIQKPYTPLTLARKVRQVLDQG